MAKMSFERLMSRTKSLSLKDLKKEGDRLYDEKIEKENSLLSAYANKKLKSKNLIFETRAVKSTRAKAKKENEKNGGSN